MPTIEGSNLNIPVIDTSDPNEVVKGNIVEAAIEFGCGFISSAS